MSLNFAKYIWGGDRGSYISLYIAFQEIFHIQVCVDQFISDLNILAVTRIICILLGDQMHTTGLSWRVHKALRFASSLITACKWPLHLLFGAIIGILFHFATLSQNGSGREGTHRLHWKHILWYGYECLQVYKNQLDFCIAVQWEKFSTRVHTWTWVCICAYVYSHSHTHSHAHSHRERDSNKKMFWKSPTFHFFFIWTLTALSAKLKVCHSHCTDVAEDYKPANLFDEIKGLYLWFM